MIQDLGSVKFDISFRNIRISDDDHVLLFNKEGHVLTRAEGDRLVFPVCRNMDALTETVYLFSVDEDRYFLILSQEEAELDGFSYHGLRELRGSCGNVDNMIAFTAYHLWRWYMNERFCGRCGGKLTLKNDERALKCECGNVVYPRINPAVIVGVIKGDTILVTRYRRGFAHNALVAGFVEIGETLEQTVRREVMEETGIRVKNIRYYKSQPWGVAQDLLVGFFCEVDGDDEIRMDENELKSARFLRREEIELQPDSLSLTNEMMKMFKEGNSLMC